MYLHLGKGTVINTKYIIGIFDLDITSQSHLTRKYLSMAEKAGQVINAAEDIPKSFVVCDHPYHRQIVYISQLNSSTLARRSAEQQGGLEGE